MVRGTILPDQSTPVHRQHDMQLLQAYIVNHLIVGPLHKCGIDRDDRHDALRGHAGGECRRMLFGYSNIVKPLRKSFRKCIKTGPFRHGCRDRDDARICLGQCNHRIAEDSGIGNRLGWFVFRESLTGCDIKGRSSVKPRWVLLSESVPFAFFRQNMNKDWSFQLFYVLQIPDKMVEPVSLEGSYICKAQFFKNSTRHKKGFQ